MAQEDDLRALGKIMDFLRAVSIILAIMREYHTRNYECVLVLL